MKVILTFLNSPSGLIAIGGAALALILLSFAAGRYWFPRRRQQDKQDREHLLSCLEAINALVAENVEQAIERLVQLVKVDTNTIEAYFALGSLFRQKGELERAMRIFQNLLLRSDISDRTRGLAQYQLALTQERAGLLTEACQSLERVIEFFPRNIAAHRRLQALLETRRDWQRAIDVHTAISRLQKRNNSGQDELNLAYLLVELGQFQIQNNKLDAALKSLKKADSQRPKNAVIQTVLADCYVLRKDYKKAISVYAKAMEQDGTVDVLIYPKLRRLYDKINKPELYRAYLEGRYNQAPDPVIAMELARACLSADQPEEARQILEDAVKTLPLEPEWLKLSSELVTRLDRPEVTRQFLERLSASNSNSSVRFRCHSCGHTSGDRFWKCPECHGFDTRIQHPLRESNADATADQV